MTRRVVGLIVNFIGNAVLLYGAAGYLADGSRLGFVAAGTVTTIACIAALATPTR